MKATNKNTLPGNKIKYVMRSSSLHNSSLSNVNCGKPNSPTKQIGTPSAKRQKHFKPPSVNALDLLNNNMILRSQTRQKTNPKIENNANQIVSHKILTKIRKAESLDSKLNVLVRKPRKSSNDKFKKAGESVASVTQPGLNKASVIDKSKKSLDRSIDASSRHSEPTKISKQVSRSVSALDICDLSDNRKLQSKTYQKRKTLIENNTSSKKQRTSNKFEELSESHVIDNCMQLSQRSLKKPKTIDQFKESIELKYSKEIEKIINRSRLNIKERFCMKSNLECVNNFQYCQSIHSQNVQICDYYTKNSTKMLLSETRVLNFLKSLDGMVFRDSFPGVELIIELIGTILTYDRIDKSATNECIITGSLNTFHRIMHKFPPCIANIRTEYRNLIRESCYKSDIISLPNFEFQSGIFWKLIEMLETLIENDVEDDVLNLSQQSEDGYDFYTWEKRQITQHYRHNIPRDDQIDRIFYILHFLTDLMENELANWLQRHQHDNKVDEMAILTGVIWSTDLPGTITINVKRIITLFTKFVAVNFPESKIKVLSTIVNLIGNVMMHAASKNDYNSYPNRNFHFIEALSTEMFKIATDVQPSTEYSKIKLYSLIVTHLELPALKMLFGNLVIDKIENLYTQQLNLQKLYGILINDSWKIVAPKSPKKTKKRSIRDESSDSLYPIYSKTPNQSRKSYETIEFAEYVIVLFHTFKSYLNYFKLDSILSELKNPFDSKSNSSSFLSTKSPTTQIKDNSLASTKINYKLVEKNFVKSLKFFDPDEKLFKSVNATDNKVSENIKIDIRSLQQYHSDIDTFDQIVKCVQTGKDVYFKEFKEFLSDLMD